MTDRSSRRRGLLTSFVLWHGAWFAAVLGGAWGAPILGSALAAVQIAAALVLRRAGGRELAFVATIAVVGYAVDSAIVVAGLLDFPPEARWGAPSTVWMVLLWANLAAHLGPGTIFGWLAPRPALSAGLGALSGPLAYFGGSKLGAVTFPEPALGGLLTLAVVWGIAFWALFRVRSRWIAPVRPTEGVVAG